MTKHVTIMSIQSHRVWYKRLLYKMWLFSIHIYLTLNFFLSRRTFQVCYVACEDVTMNNPLYTYLSFIFI